MTAPVQPLVPAEDGPTTPALVAEWLPGSGIDETDAALVKVVAGVNASVRGWLTPSIPGPDAAWGRDQTLGVTMLAARFYRRRNSPGGVDSVTDAGSPVYVRTTDPDIAQLLGLGRWTKPRIR